MDGSHDLINLNRAFTVPENQPVPATATPGLPIRSRLDT
jgi:hypothetical protein